MTWFTKLFIRQRVQDFVQNYKDCPANWKVNSTFKRITNEKHKLMIEFHANLQGIYNLGINSFSVNKDDLNYFERRYLIKTFTKAFFVDLPIPTKATKPEDFI